MLCLSNMTLCSFRVQGGCNMRLIASVVCSSHVINQVSFEIQWHPKPTGSGIFHHNRIQPAVEIECQSNSDCSWIRVPVDVNMHWKSCVTRIQPRMEIECHSISNCSGVRLSLELKLQSNSSVTWFQPAVEYGCSWPLTHKCMQVRSRIELAVEIRLMAVEKYACCMCEWSLNTGNTQTTNLGWVFLTQTPTEDFWV